MSYPIGEIKILNITGEVSSGVIYVRPPEGLEWLIIDLYQWHNDVLGADTYWQIFNSDLGHSISGRILETLDPNKNSFFTISEPYSISAYQLVPRSLIPPKLTYYCFAVAMSDVAAGSRNFVAGLVVERPENLELRLVEWFAEKMKWPLPPGLEMLKSRLTQYRAGP